MRSVSLAVSPAVSLTESEIGVTVAVAPTRAVARVHACMHMLMRVVIYMKTLLKRASLLANESVVAAPGAAPARAARRPAAGAGRPRRARPLEILGVARCVRPPRVPRLSTPPDSFHCSLV